MYVSMTANIATRTRMHSFQMGFMVVDWVERILNEAENLMSETKQPQVIMSRTEARNG